VASGQGARLTLDRAGDADPGAGRAESFEFDPLAQPIEARPGRGPVSTEYLVAVSEADPVAVAIAERWGTPPATGDHVEGAVVRQLAPGVEVVRRRPLHIHDERLDRVLPARLRTPPVTTVFPSVHRSRENVECLTVHPLGNPGPTAELGGQPRTVNPTDPLRMTAALRRLSEGGAPEGLRATFEATHHGPELDLPSFFVEIGFGDRSGPSPAAVRVVASAIAGLESDPSDRVVMGVGGGHYAPHFTDLALKRRWAFGHLLSRHALNELDGPTAATTYARTRGSTGILFARAQDAEHPSLAGLGPRRRENEAPPRVERSDPPTPFDRSTSGT
jgi:D-tyrosyl-tRNA(Tyr) deacylase